MGWCLYRFLDNWSPFRLRKRINFLKKTNASKDKALSELSQKLAAYKMKEKVK